MCYRKPQVAVAVLKKFIPDRHDRHYTELEFEPEPIEIKICEVDRADKYERIEKAICETVSCEKEKKRVVKEGKRDYWIKRK